MVAPNAREILEAAMKLTPAERVAIADQLWDTADAEEDGELSPEWQKEIERRLELLEQGKLELLDGEPIMRALKEGRMP